MGTLRTAGRHVGAASLAGIIAGALVGGLLGRIVMRVAGATSRPEQAGAFTANGNLLGDITFGGTLALILFVGVIAGIGGGVLFASAEPWLRSSRWKGLLFGVALLVGLGFTVLDPGNIDFLRFGISPLNIAMFAALFLAFGVAVAWFFDRIRRAIDGTGTLARGLEITGWLAAVAAGALGALSFVSVGGLGDPLPALLLASAVLIPPLVRWRGLPRAVAYAAFAVPVAVGGSRTLLGLRELLG